ncbi:MAG: hypothetical protein K2W95_03510 [Candidatus Obscuribacterales bacterium]|nr:hypothetical protein [Candidatus Obscuribacterales bacterium]
MTATTLKSTPASVKVSRNDTTRGVFLALAVMISALLIGAAPSAGLLTLVSMDQMRTAAAVLGLAASMLAIPALFRASQRDDLKSMLALVAFIGTTIGFLIPLSL